MTERQTEGRKTDRKTERQKDTKTQRHKDTETQRRKTERQRLIYTGSSFLKIINCIRL